MAGRMYICRVIIDHYVVLCIVLYDQIYKQSQAFAQIYDEIDKLQKFYRDSKDNKETKEIKEGDAV